MVVENDLADVVVGKYVNEHSPACRKGGLAVEGEGEGVTGAAAVIAAVATATAAIATAGYTLR